MQRRFLPFFWACTLLLLLTQAADQARAASYVVAPFKVNGPAGFSYLQNAIPPMLSSRLFWQGKFEPAAGQDAALRGSAPADRNAAEKLRGSSGADYVVWGSVSVLGNEASLDVNVMDGAGKVWQRSSNAPLNNLISGLQTTADAINSEVFGKPVTQARTGTNTVAPLNPDFMVNETQAGTVYLNPEIRYQGTERERLRSQMLDYRSFGMEVADIDGDSQNEILTIDEDKLRAYRWNKGRLNPIAEFTFPTMIQPLLVRSLEQQGRCLIVVSGFDTNSSDPKSFIFGFRNGEFVVLEGRIPYYLNVANLPPMYEPAIIGQGGERSRVVHGPIYEMIDRGGSFGRGSAVAGLPDEANVFNFVWVPGNVDGGGDHLVALGPQENLLTFDAKGERLAKSDDQYSGAAVGIAHSTNLPGMGAGSDTTDLKSYFIPMRMLAVDLENDGRHELLVNKPVTTAGRFFANYRTFPQGEIHALVWDGIGLDLLWKTRRIKGSVVDYTVADANNDGVMDLVVNVNTYPGALGVAKTRTLVTLYPLDSANASPDTPVSPDFDN